MRRIFGAIFYALIGVSCAIAGVKESFVSLVEREPTTIQCAAAQPGTTKAKWLKIEGCVAQLSEATHFTDEKTNRIEHLLVPIIAVDADRESPIHAVLLTKNDKWIADYEVMARNVKAAKSDEEVFAMFAKKPELFEKTEVFSGQIAGLPSSEMKQFLDLEKRLAPQFLVIKHNEQPSLGAGIFTGIIGLAFFGAGARKLFRRV